MRKTKQVFTMVMVVLLAIVTGANAQTPDTPSRNDLKVISMGESSMLLELTVADFEVETLTAQGETFQRIVIPDMAQTDVAGEPQLPVHGSWLGLSGLSDLSVNVVESQSETLAESYNIYPAPAMELVGETGDESVVELFSQNSRTYANNSFLPGELVKIGDTGYMREQAVAQLQFYPVQYNPVTDELQLYRRLVVEVSWRGSARSADTYSAGTAYESVLQQTLLNYNDLPRAQAPRRTARQGQVVEAPGNSTNMVKINLTEAGLYQVSYEALESAGLNVTGIDPSTIKLHNQGTEVAIYVETATAGSFAAGDAVLFYATEIARNIYTDNNVYLLSVGGAAGKRMTTRDGTPASATIAQRFLNTVHAEENNAYAQQMPNPQEGEDLWFWGERLSPNTSGLKSSRPYTVTLNNVADSTEQATVQVRLRGFTDDRGADPNHHVKVYINDTDIEPTGQTWKGHMIYDYQFSFSQNLLQEGDNFVRVEAPGDTEANIDQFYVNWVEIDYSSTYQAVDDALHFSAPQAETFRYQIGGFSNPTIRLFDVSNPAEPVRIMNGAVAAQNGTQQITFEDTSTENSEYLAVATPTALNAPDLMLDEASSWRTEAQQADYLLITHRAFYTQAMQLANHRSQRGNMTVAVVKVSDLYDEFNNSIFTPRALHDFIAYTYNSWQSPKPSYVLLMGDANIDYKNNRNASPPDFVPTYLVRTAELGQTPSDNPYVLVSGEDKLPDMVLGRLPPATPAEAAAMVNKIINYDTNQQNQDWSDNVLLIADNGNSANPDDPAFTAISETLAETLPYYYNTERVYAETYEGSGNSPAADIISQINDGSLLVNYAGHGAVNLWGKWNSENENIFDTGDIANLNNGSRLPVVTVANCLSGFFTANSSSERPFSMAEEFLRADNKGAVAVWAPTALDYPQGHRTLMEGFYNQLYQQDKYALGSATTAAKLNAYAQNNFWLSLVETFILFGDPAMELGLPPNYPYLTEAVPPNGATGVPTVMGLELVFSKPVNTSTITVEQDGVPLDLSTLWDDEGTVVIMLNDNNQPFGQMVNLEVKGEDLLGQPLQEGPIPNPWSYTIEQFAPISGVTIEAPQVGYVNMPTPIKAQVTPFSVTLPITYSWQATEQEDQMYDLLAPDSTIDLTWSKPGQKVINVTAANSAGTVTATHKLTIPGTLEAVSPEEGGTVNYTSPDNTTAEVILPSNATTATFNSLVVAPIMTPTRSTSSLTYSNRAFHITLFTGDIAVENAPFDAPLQITISYLDSDVANVNEETLNLYYYDTAAGMWKKATESCSPTGNIQLDTVNNTVTAQVCHLTEFALFDDGGQTAGVGTIFLPILMKQ